MALSRKLRRFSPWLLGLFLVAQLGAVVPLLTADLQHDIETESDIAADLAATGTVNHAHSHHAHRIGANHDHAGHDHTGVDVNDQCCTIHHHLGGVLPFTIAELPDEFPAIRSPVSCSRRPPGSDPRGMERPPKLLVSL
jgi:hypothetical protein